MLRQQLTESLKESMKARDTRAVSTLRLILAALKDRDICARGRGNNDGITDTEIQQMLQSMIKQRHDSIDMYERGGRCELAEQERGEIVIIEGFLPTQLGEEEIATAVERAITDVQPSGVKDMGKVMAFLKQHYPGQMDFAKASGLLRGRLVA
ncbi:MAG: GatB/YqeY domain-containing protein [Alphaproteobacteria bacterium]|nr:GatB/YqeY domain-containing protein [Alphaproteobacteria bacterium]MBU0796772.1 GatB/YqeY domain-containing protein [Alphaproteobacteria bacterium]MBU0887019.1 GatB/YqeY domain-containing protein [Alphaproteobacteria bacterium]MBU1811873.1 GatB/YqeY domain-containing protein [Alphaproteobacteria bacterium]MBU2090879.1 GatB/YqeY domain-containing protein [Alphaproteobacteria bacterium]